MSDTTYTAEADLAAVYRRIRPMDVLHHPDATYVDTCWLISDLTAQPFDAVFEACSGEDA